MGAPLATTTLPEPRSVVLNGSESTEQRILKMYNNLKCFSPVGYSGYGITSLVIIFSKLEFLVHEI